MTEALSLGHMPWPHPRPWAPVLRLAAFRLLTFQFPSYLHGAEDALPGRPP